MCVIFSPTVDYLNIGGKRATSLLLILISTLTALMETIRKNEELCTEEQARESGRAYVYYC